MTDLDRICILAAGILATGTGRWDKKQIERVYGEARAMLDNFQELSSLREDNSKEYPSNLKGKLPYGIKEKV